MTIRFFLSAFGFIATLAAANAQEGAPSAFDRQLVQPAFVMRHADTVGLSEEQKETVLAAMDEAKDQFIQGQRELDRANSAIQELLGEEDAPADDLIAAVKSMLDAESALKLTRFAMMFRVARVLTDEQREQIDQLAQSDRPMTRAEHKLIQHKLQTIQQVMQMLSEGGIDKKDVVELIQQCSFYLEAGDYETANGILDNALQNLGLDPAEVEKKAPK